MAGAFGSTASMAASAQDSSSAGCPKYRQAAASSPTTFPPKGACEMYIDRIFLLKRETQVGWPGSFYELFSKSARFVSCQTDRLHGEGTSSTYNALIL